MSNRLTAAIFDLDGVLVDTAEFHYRAWKRLAGELGVTFDRAKNERLKGVPRMRSLEIILEDVSEQDIPEDGQALASRKNRYYRQLVATLTPDHLLPGVEGFLRALRQKRVLIGVASSSKNAREVLLRLGIESLLDAIVDGNGFRNPKPAPDIFLNCAAQLGKEPWECTVIEDAQAGIRAAKNAGMYAVGVCPDAELTGADRLVKCVADIPLNLWSGRDCISEHR